MWHSIVSRPALVVFAVGTALVQGILAPSAGAKPATVVVPTDYASIQEAIDAAPAGGTVKVSAGTYTEQLTIHKNLTIVGAGVDQTVVRAPAVLLPLEGLDPDDPDEANMTAIVEISNFATVAISNLTVSGPGSGSCEVGALRWGIRVHEQAYLDFGHAAVREIHDSPMAPCLRSGSGIAVGSPSGLPASVSVDHSEITDYQSVGIVVLGFGSVGDVAYSIIRGPGAVAGTQGIELVVGAVGTIDHNTISGNVCPPGDPFCGTDWFTQFQSGGISAGGNGPGTVVTHNLVFGNQIGIFLSEVDEFSQNVMVDNDLFGLAIIGTADGMFTVDHGSITGGGGGLWAIGLYADTTIVLNKVLFSGQSGPTVEVLNDDPSIPDDPYYTVTIIGGP